MNRAVLGFRVLITFFAFLLLGLILDFPMLETPINVPVRNAEARIGRPATPASVGGVRRRTRRRTILIGTRVYTRPAGYTTVVVTGTTYYVHDGVYYKPYYEGDKVVYVVVEKP